MSRTVTTEPVGGLCPAPPGMVACYADGSEFWTFPIVGLQQTKTTYTECYEFQGEKEYETEVAYDVHAIALVEGATFFDDAKNSDVRRYFLGFAMNDAEVQEYKSAAERNAKEAPP